MNIEIRHVETSDSAALKEIYAHVESLNGTLQLPFPTEDLWKERIEGLPPGGLSLVAVVDEKVVGHAGLFAIPKSRRRGHAASVGITVHPEWYRKGVGMALMGAIIDAADNWHNYIRLELTVYTDNEAAINLYKKLGFEIEGTHLKYAYRNGEYVDALCMARVR